MPGYVPAEIEHRAETDSGAAGLRAFFDAAAVAVVGASSSLASPYARPLTYLLDRGFPGPVFPINPNRTELAGVPCYPRLTEIPQPVDLVMVLTSASRVLDSVRDAADVGARAVIVCSSGFAELGDEGRRLQADLREFAAGRAIRILGPNSQGLIYGPRRLAATFTAGLPAQPADRGVAYIGQSGAIGGCLLDQAVESGLPMAAWVSTGNQVDADTVGFARTLIADDHIDALLLYVEAIADGRSYVELAEMAEQAGKPMIVLRSGRSSTGRRANVSHTGATLADDTAFRLVSERHGVVLVDDLDAAVLATQCAVSLGRPTGPRLAVVTTSGGAGGLAADWCADLGLAVPELSQDLRAKIAHNVPRFGSVTNPVDVTAQVLADPSSVGQLCSELAASDEVDAVLVLVSMVVGDQALALAADLAAVGATARMPVLTAWLAGDSNTAGPRDIFGRAGQPVVRSVGDAVRVMRDLISAAGPRAAEPPSAPAGAPTRMRTLVEGQCADLLETFRIARPPGRLVQSATEATAVAHELAGPAVLKLQSAAVLHKTELNAVRLNVLPEDAATVYDELVEIGRRVAPDVPCAVLVQAMAEPGLELIVGVIAADDGFPPVITLGAGGTLAELHEKRAHAVLPIDDEQAMDLIDQLPLARTLRGYRGGLVYDVAAVRDLLVRLGSLAVSIGAPLREVEINPVRVYESGRGALALDFLMRVAEDAPR